MDSGLYRLVRMVWLRAALALVILVTMSLQPGMVAMAKSAIHPVTVAGISAATDVPSHESGSYEHRSEAVFQTNDMGAVSHHGDSVTADNCCDTHCAPSLAVPVGFPPLPQPSSGVLALNVTAAVRPGETADFLRPPRT